MEQFKIAGGSVAGRDHIISNKPNQDAYDWIEDDEFIIATVSDGCGGSPHSEIGAKLGVKLFNSYVLEHIKDITQDDMRVFILNYHRTLEIATILLNKKINRLAVDTAHDMGYKKTLNDYFLFTIVNTIITKKNAGVAVIGDGIFQFNERLTVVESKDNTPDYPIYSLLGKPFTITHATAKGDHINDPWDFLLIGSDGCNDLIQAADKTLPGKKGKVGELRQFYDNDKFYKNPDMVRRRLAQINKTTQRIDWDNKKINTEHGHLKDDTTLICIKTNYEKGE